MIAASLLLSVALVSVSAEAPMAGAMTDAAIMQVSAEPATGAALVPPEEIDPFLQPVVDVKAVNEAERLADRRSYLKFHQAAGLTTLAMLTGQVILGQYLMNERQAGNLGEDYDRLQSAHLGLGIATFTVYSAAAISQLLAPKIEEREGEFSTVTVHKALALIHGTGMLVTPFMGWYMTEQRENAQTLKDFERIDRLNTIHQATGYATLGALAGAALVITF